MVGLLEYDISISIPVSLPVYTQCKPLPLNWLGLGEQQVAWLGSVPPLSTATVAGGNVHSIL